LFPAEIEVLDLSSCVFVTEAPSVGVVEIHRSRAHSADIQGEHVPYPNSALLHVWTHRALHKRSNVKVIQRLLAAGLCKAFLDRGLVDVPSFWVHPYGNDTVGDLGRERDTFWADRCGVDFHVTAAVQDALERLAEAR